VNGKYMPDGDQRLVALEAAIRVALATGQTDVEKIVDSAIAYHSFLTG
jgi:hypothetical protein